LKKTMLRREPAEAAGNSISEPNDTREEEK